MQSATTTTAAAAKGATTVYVTETTGLAAGSYVTLGTIETESVSPGANLEQVYITAASASSGAGNITIRGDGKANNFGLRFDHASGEAVTEAYNVAAIPLIGKESLIGIYGADTGMYGKPIEKLGTLDLMERMYYYSWYWYGGVSAIQKHMMLGKVAVSDWIMGTN